MFGTSIGRRFAVLLSTIRIWFWEPPVFALPQIDLHLMSRLKAALWIPDPALFEDEGEGLA